MKIPIIYFHSISDEIKSNWFRNYLTLPVDAFEEFLIYLNANKWSTIQLDEYYDIQKSGRRISSKICCLTFDDGYVDNYIFAYPLLQKYGFTGTIFISPEFIENRNELRPTLFDVWEESRTKSELKKWGFVSWEEIISMQQSKIIDIQSHTMSHTKYFVSDKLISLHHPGCDCLYPIGNIFPEKKPYYINDPSFEYLIPFGFPFFEEESAVTARVVQISNEFNLEFIEAIGKEKLETPLQRELAWKNVQPLYNAWKQNEKIIANIESEEDRMMRLEYEISRSKEILEEKLDKIINHLCWPHGDNSQYLHNIALNAGYKTTTQGKCRKVDKNIDPSRIPERIGINFSSFSNEIKTKLKINAFAGRYPQKLLLSVYRKLSSY